MSVARLKHHIGGKRVDGASDANGPVFDPATGRQIRSVPLATEADVDLAVRAARTASEEWSRSSTSTRSKLLFRFRTLIEENAEQLSSLITEEHGKVTADALGEIARGLECVEYACNVGGLLSGAHSSGVASGVDVWSTRRPLGVIAGITPFNFPLMVPLWMIPNAVACGNAFVLKPSEKVPSAALLLAELFDRAGFPEGVLNVVHGDASAVDYLLQHTGVDAVSFVGSTPVARHIHQIGSACGKRVQALGGAKNHMVVLPDADIDLAADAAVSAGFGSAGQRCMAISVVVAVGGTADRLVDSIASRAERVSIGAGSDPHAEMGPLITQEHRDRVASYVDAAESDGARVVVDGRAASLPRKGFFLGCTLLDAVRPGMSVYDDEVFGPVLAVVRVESFEEAIELIRQSPYGNGVALFTRDGGAARRFADDVDVGMVGINVPIPVPVAHHSFGGWKGSLFGDAHMYGPEGIRFYSRAQVVTSRWPSPQDSVVDLGFPSGEE